MTKAEVARDATSDMSSSTEPRKQEIGGKGGEQRSGFAQVAPVVGEGRSISLSDRLQRNSQKTVNALRPRTLQMEYDRGSAAKKRSLILKSIGRCLRGLARPLASAAVATLCCVLVLGMLTPSSIDNGSLVSAFFSNGDTSIRLPDCDDWANRTRCNDADRESRALTEFGTEMSVRQHRSYFLFEIIGYFCTTSAGLTMMFLHRVRRCYLVAAVALQCAAALYSVGAWVTNASSVDYNPLFFGVAGQQSALIVNIIVLEFLCPKDCRNTRSAREALVMVGVAIYNVTTSVALVYFIMLCGRENIRAELVLTSSSVMLMAVLAALHRILGCLPHVGLEVFSTMFMSTKMPTFLAQRLYAQTVDDLGVLIAAVVAQSLLELFIKIISMKLHRREFSLAEEKKNFTEARRSRQVRIIGHMSELVADAGSMWIATGLLLVSDPRLFRFHESTCHGWIQSSRIMQNSAVLLVAQVLLSVAQTWFSQVAYNLHDYEFVIGTGEGVYINLFVSGLTSLAFAFPMKWTQRVGCIWCSNEGCPAT